VKIERNTVYWLYVVVMAGILYFAFRPVIDNPEHYLFGDGGDGLKNYFTLTHYVRHDSGVHFSGMNYPYGEHIVFTDNQPGLAMLLRWVSHHIVNLDNHLVGLLNIWMIFSILLAGWFVLRILKFFGLPDWYALIIAFLIVFLSPQMSRLPGHYALSYAFYIPGILYYLLRIFSGRAGRGSLVALAILTFAAAMTHLYFLAINMMMIGVFVFFAWILSGRTRPTRRALLTLLITGVLSLSVIAWVKMSDSISDRPVKPYGVDTYTASFESVFFPHQGILDETFQFGNQQWEGESYVGVFGLFFLVIFGGYFLYRLVRRKPVVVEVKAHRLLYAMGLTGVVLLLFATHFFHRIDIFGVLDHLGPLSQFRSIGRFAWVFYYTYLIFAAVYLYRFFSSRVEQQRSNWAYLVLLPVLLIWNNEAILNFKSAIKTIFHKNEVLIDRAPVFNEFLESKGVSPSDFQAILQLPLVVLGSEVFGIEEGIWPMRWTMRCSHSTGLPIMDIMMSRTSLKQSLDLLQLLGEMPVERSRLQFMDERLVLLLVKKDEARPQEQNLISKAKLLGEVDHVLLYSLPVTALRSHRDRLYEKYHSIPSDTTLIEGPPGYVFMDNYEDEQTPFAFNGQGAKWVADTTIICIDIPRDTQYYELSAWVRIDPKSGKRPEVFNDYAHDGEHHTQRLLLKNAVDTKGYWVRYTVTVDPGMHHCLRIEGAAWVDAVLVRPDHSHVILKKEDMLLYDNCTLNH